MAKKKLPYVDSYNQIPNLLSAISTAQVPPKFSYNFLETVLMLKSSSYRAMIPLLKQLGFVDVSNLPTEIYKNYRDPGNAKKILAKQVKSAYIELYKVNDYAHKLTKAELTGKVKSILETNDTDVSIQKIVGTFQALVNLSDFEGTINIPGTNNIIAEKPDENKGNQTPPKVEQEFRLGIGYNIHLNLPATSDIEVYDAIFKSLKEQLLK